MVDPELHCANGHVFLRSESGRGPNRRCPLCGRNVHNVNKAGCLICADQQSIKMFNEKIPDKTMNITIPAFTPAFTPDTIIAIANAFERMPDSELLAIAEECFRHCGPPRDASGRPIPMDMDSHEATMYHVVIPQLIARLARKI